MKIKYKFNKSSEARDCKVESVELQCPETVKRNVLQKPVIDCSLEDFLQELETNLNLNKKQLEEYILSLVTDLLCDIYEERYSYGSSYNEAIDCFEIIIDNKYVMWCSNFDSIDKYHDKDVDYDINIYISKCVNSDYDNNKIYEFLAYHIVKTATGDIRITSVLFEINNIKKYGNETLVEVDKIEFVDKQFTSPQELKNYLNAIQEPIEFETDNPLDELILKEWLGEWEVKEEKIYVDSLDLVNSPDHLDIIETYFKKQTKVGSPKLNPNWTLKLK